MRNRGAVDFDKRAFAATSAVVQDSRGQALAGSGFARQEQRTQRNSRESGEQLANGSRCHAPAYESFRCIAAVFRRRALAQLSLRAGAACSARDHEVQPLKLAGFLQEIERSKPKRPDRIGDASVSGEKKPFATPGGRSYSFEQIESVTVGQAHIGYDYERLYVVIQQQASCFCE